jgi:nucleotide-binding universal stress UspA family protein
MRTVVAAIDNSLAAKPVLAAARAFGALLGADVDAVYVRSRGEEGPRAIADSANVQLRVMRGDVVERLVNAASAEEVAAVVIGAHGLPTHPRPLGSTAEAVATSVRKPVLVVPPEAGPPERFTRVLVPLEEAVSSSLAPRSLIELARGSDVGIGVVHVIAPDAVPAFTDQPQHEQAAWAREFVARYCPAGIDVVRFEARVGRIEDVIPAVADEWACELIALGWSQQLSGGRARVVRAVLERTNVPVLLVPVRVGDRGADGRSAMIAA